MGDSGIDWCDKTWNPITGCDPVSAGCKNCWAKRMAKRLAGRCGYPPAPDEFTVTLQDNRLREPYAWRKPRRVFVCSMSDLFHRQVPDTYLDQVFQVMKETPQHTYQLLTKRPVRMHDYLSGLGSYNWPLLNVWLGVTIENQVEADWRIRWLAQTPAAVHWLSLEPLLEAIDLQVECGHGVGDLALEGGYIDWVVVGAESGPGRRPMNEDWVRALKDQCVEHAVAFFYKQRYYEVTGKREHMPTLDNRRWAQYPGDMDRTVVRCNQFNGPCNMPSCIHSKLHYPDVGLQCQTPSRCLWHRVRDGRKYQRVCCEEVALGTPLARWLALYGRGGGGEK